MGSLTDKVSGKVKEVAGVATGDRKLEGEGKLDTLKGNIKEGFENAKHAVKDAVHSNKDSKDTEVVIKRS